MCRCGTPISDLTLCRRCGRFWLLCWCWAGVPGFNLTEAKLSKKRMHWWSWPPPPLPRPQRAWEWCACSLMKRGWLCWWDIKNLHLFLSANWRKLLVFSLIRAALPCSSLWKWARAISRGVIGRKVHAQRGNPPGFALSAALSAAPADVPGALLAHSSER